MYKSSNCFRNVISISSIILPMLTTCVFTLSNLHVLEACRVKLPDKLTTPPPPSLSGTTIESMTVVVSLYFPSPLPPSLASKIWMESQHPWLTDLFFSVTSIVHVYPYVLQCNHVPMGEVKVFRRKGKKRKKSSCQVCRCNAKQTAQQINDVHRGQNKAPGVHTFLD